MTECAVVPLCQTHSAKLQPPENIFFLRHCVDRSRLVWFLGLSTGYTHGILELLVLVPLVQRDADVQTYVSLVIKV